MRSPTSCHERGNDLFELLSRARIDEYQRRKPKDSRDHRAGWATRRVRDRHLLAAGTPCHAATRQHFSNARKPSRTTGLANEIRGTRWGYRLSQEVILELRLELRNRLRSFELSFLHAICHSRLFDLERLLASSWVPPANTQG